jgi:hypothetical protein
VATLDSWFETQEKRCLTLIRRSRAARRKGAAPLTFVLSTLSTHNDQLPDLRNYRDYLVSERRLTLFNYGLFLEGERIDNN